MTISIPRPEHPRPDLERADWLNLNGPWQFSFDPADVGVSEGRQNADPSAFPETITVPFPWESALSGICRPDYRGVAWYRREFTVPDGWAGKRVMLCFGAVDYLATVWVNGVEVGRHEGGYSEFRLDVSAALSSDGQNVVCVRVLDVNETDRPLGKQIDGWYTASGGIWQTVWLEAVGAAAVTGLRIETPGGADGAPTGEARFSVRVDGSAARVEVSSPDGRFAGAGSVGSDGSDGSFAVCVAVQDPVHWSPDTPELYDAVICVVGADGTVLDTVRTYFGLRTVGWGPYAGSDFSYVLLNGKPIYTRGALDQSFNPDGLYTAPDDALFIRDMEIAKESGLNMLRIHIKAEEPRRLYWADKMGVLIQADIPCFYEVVERGRTTFEATMRDQIARDWNHPSIYCWTVFNEEWGIGSPEKTPAEHRIEWVERMFALARELDPTRLVQDQTGWRHLISDLNSFHWYSRDVDGFREQYREIDANRVNPGDDWNYIAGRKQRGEPFINNEYGYVGAGNGDSDWSWGNLFATSAMRGCPKLVGYTYTELTDIEWEHNGIANYDRSPKEFGYDYWAPGMTVADVFSEDFVVLDVPAIKRAAPGEAVSVPVTVSHYSGCLAQGARVRWHVRHASALMQFAFGESGAIACGQLPAYRVSPVGQISIQMPAQPGLVTLSAWVEAADGTRRHTTYTQWLVGMESRLPSVEHVGARGLVLRFRPEEFAESAFSLQSAPDRPIAGKHYGRGSGVLRYEVALPAGLDLAHLDKLSLALEVSAKAGREKVDWPAKAHPEDYPQTDGQKFPSHVTVAVNGISAGAWDLEDDPADARGVLSHWAGVERGSYGYLVHATLSASQVRAALEASDKVQIELTTNEGGIAIYGAEMGCFPIDPIVVLSFTKPL